MVYGALNWLQWFSSVPLHRQAFYCRVNENEDPLFLVVCRKILTVSTCGRVTLPRWCLWLIGQMSVKPQLDMKINFTSSPFLPSIVQNSVLLLFGTDNSYKHWVHALTESVNKSWAAAVAATPKTDRWIMIQCGLDSRRPSERGASHSRGWCVLVSKKVLLLWVLRSLGGGPSNNNDYNSFAFSLLLSGDLHEPAGAAKGPKAPGLRGAVSAYNLSL